MNKLNELRLEYLSHSAVMFGSSPQGRVIGRRFLSLVPNKNTRQFEYLFCLKCGNPNRGDSTSKIHCSFCPSP